ncbi:MAG: alanine--tRNA ligase [Actinomycetota bacterium]
MKSAEIRSKFLEYFARLDHTILPGSSLVPDEPSLLLTTAGMVQFIPYLRGDKKPEHARMATVQRCLRTTDIDHIGHTARHLTFFEMLGNFSVGDYYKKEAIPWAWEFVTKELKIDSANLWVSIFLDDDEAFDVWHKDVGLPDERIVRLGEDENFWSMGPTGPCGPCSEIHYDFGPDKACGPDCAVGCDCDRFLEIWNLVFMQYDRDEDGELKPLPKKNIDTGMGLERVASILQGVDNNFESDLLKALIDKMSEISGVAYKSGERQDVSLKIVADHSRAVAFIINDGVLPSNEGRGYVLRRLLRRAVRHGRLLGVERPFMKEMAGAVIDLMGGDYKDIAKNRHSIEDIVKSEEVRFLDTLKAGLSVLDGYLDDAAAAGADMLEADKTFKLYDTYGFPFELTKEIAAEQGIGVDETGFAGLMDKQKETARQAVGETKGKAGEEALVALAEECGQTEFTGYGNASAEAKIKAIFREGKEVKTAKAEEKVEIILDRTPFYAEMGGQIGDTGSIKTKTGRVEVSSAFPNSGLTVHVGKVAEGSIKEAQEAEAAIDMDRRQAVRRNHTATHILHWALRMTLGDHVRQGGSYVDNKRLRFDFTHGKALTKQELDQVERLINKKVIEDSPVRAYATTYKYATESGALAFFGEKYGKHVRVLEVGDYSRELCGGTHVARSGEIGLVKIISESSIGANLRRIEAVTGLNTLERARESEALLLQFENELKTGRAGIAGRLSHLMLALKASEKEVHRLKSKLGSADTAGLWAGAESVNGVKLVFTIVKDKKPDELRVIADDIRGRGEPAVVGLASESDGNVGLIIAMTKDLTAKGLDAGKIIREVAPRIGGGGGGRPDLAQAGGSEAGGMVAAIDAARQKVIQKLS